MRTLRIEELELVAGAGEDPCCSKDCEPERVKGNNGLGNGDQAAPGGSLIHNAAENNINNASGTGNPPGSDNWPVRPD
jgi:hypothetical protein